MEKYNYFTVNLVHSEQLLEFTGLKDFNRFLITQKLTTIFLLNSAEGEPTHFAVSYKGGMLRQLTEGFRSLEDYNESLREQFPDSASFYSARQMGYKNYADYKVVTESGISNADEFKAMKEKGFAEGFAEWKSGINGDADRFSNAFEFYKDAVAKGFEDYRQLKKAGEKGFTDGNIYKIALSKQFENADDYNLALEMGFDNGMELQLARTNNIRDRADLMRYLDLELFKNTGCKHDQRLTLVLLSKLPQNKKISINKLDELLQKEMIAYKYTDTKDLPSWFTLAFTGRPDLVDFLRNNNAVKKYGHYDSDGEFFETKGIQSRKVVIDGSNVAYNSQGDRTSKPFVSNMISVVKEFKNKGFTDITVIADASLRHRLEDKDKLGELKKMVEYMEAPAESPADIFIIQYVKRQHCLLVSNDLFREWKLLDPWVALNIDYYRISFMIKDDTVMLPDLEKM